MTILDVRHDDMGLTDMMNRLGLMVRRVLVGATDPGC